MCRGRYEGGFFKAQLDFPPDFPNQPPVMTFKSQMWHPNVYEDGKVREQLLYEESSGRQGRQGWHSTELHGGRLLSGAEPEPGCPPWGWGAGVCQANSSAGPDANLALVHAPRVSRAVSRGSRAGVHLDPAPAGRGPVQPAGVGRGALAAHPRGTPPFLLEMNSAIAGCRCSSRSEAAEHGN